MAIKGVKYDKGEIKPNFVDAIAKKRRKMYFFVCSTFFGTMNTIFSFYVTTSPDNNIFSEPIIIIFFLALLMMSIATERNKLRNYCTENATLLFGPIFMVLWQREKTVAAVTKLASDELPIPKSMEKEMKKSAALTFFIRSLLDLFHLHYEHLPDKKKIGTFLMLDYIFSWRTTSMS